ncbi:MAG: bifunctional DNA-binding transcriptional regulator/O6-methylguanine-DNA methyltransferase Ada [Gemmatimonadales bacterium]
MINIMSVASSQERSWKAVLERDSSQDGRFVFGVRTTGIFCRPSCPARRPKRENVEFFPATIDAEVAGYRACKRCRPDQSRPDRLAEVRSILETAESAPEVSLETLARRVGISPSHLQRTFKARYGVSPRQFVVAHRGQRLRRALREQRSVARASYEAGFGSSSRLYEAADAMLGMTPARYARGGAGQLIEYTIVPIRHGLLLVATTDRGVCAAFLGLEPGALTKSLQQEFPRAEIAMVAADRDGRHGELLHRVARHIDQGTPPGRLPVDLSGTEFQLRVWRALQSIPRGKTRSYAEVASAIGNPRAVRAVATAIGSNRLAVLVPCHRVVRGDGTLGGYRWGESIKRRLLDEERPTG